MESESKSIKFKRYPTLVLTALKGDPFEPLQSAELKFLSLKRAGDLQAFLFDDSCLEFGPSNSQVVLRLQPGYVPKVPTTPFRDQLVNLQVLPREEEDPAIALLCPVNTLRIYVDRTQSFRTSDQHFVCFGGQQKGKAVSKQRLAHWIVVAIGYTPGPALVCCHMCILPQYGSRRASVFPWKRDSALSAA